MKIKELEVFETPNISEVFEMDDKYVINRNDYEVKYWKVYHKKNLIYPLRTILNRYKYNTTNGSKFTLILKKMIEEELEIFYNQVLHIE